MKAFIKNLALILLLLSATVGAYKGAEFLFDRPAVSTVSTENLSIVNLLEEPEQTMLEEARLLYERNDGFQVYAIAEYKIQGIVLEKSVNEKYGGESIYPIDVAIIWGEQAKTNYKKYLDTHYTNTITNTNRTLWVTLKKDAPNGWSLDEITNHISNNHISPANANIYKAISSLKDGDVVILEGYLLRTEWYGHTKDSSLSRTDSDCEDFYVEKIQIGNTVFQ
jgi:hypothetical protein